MDFYIVFEGQINQESTLRLVSALQKAKNFGSTNIVILFSSLGGNIYEGFILSSIIQNFPIPINIHATNHIDSIGNVVYLAGKTRTSESYAKFYMHGASTQGNFDENALKDQLLAVQTNNSRIAYFISENSRLQLKKVQSMMKKGTTITAQDALKYAMVQEIIHKEVPSSAQREEVIYIN